MATTMVVIAPTNPGGFIFALGYYGGHVVCGTLNGRLFSLTGTTLTHIGTIPSNRPAAQFIVHDDLIYVRTGQFGTYTWDGIAAVPSQVAAGSAAFFTHLALHDGVLFGGVVNSGTPSIQWWSGAFWVNYATMPALADRPMGLVSFGGSLYCVTTNGALWRVTSGSVTQVAPDLPNLTTGFAGFTPTVFRDELYVLNPNSALDGVARLFKWDGVSAWLPVALMHDVTCRQMIWMAAHNGRLYGTAQTSTHFLQWAPGDTTWKSEVSTTVGTGSDVVESVNGRLLVGSTVLHEAFPVPTRQSSILPSSRGKISHSRILRGYRNDAAAKTFHDNTMAAVS